MTCFFSSGNAARAAEDLRERLEVDFFVLAVNTTREARMMLNRLVGDEFIQQRIITISGAHKLQGAELVQIGQALCGNIEPAAATIRPPPETPHRTTKREVDLDELVYK